MNKYLIYLIIFCSFFLVSNSVNAEEISQFCDYTNPCLNTEDIENIAMSNNIDTSIYDGYFISYTIYNNKITFYLSYFKSEIFNNKYFYINNENAVRTSGFSGYNLYFPNYEIPLNFENSNYYINDFTNSSIDTVVGNPDNYYTNVDILDQNGNILLPANANNSENSYYNVYFHLNGGIAVDSYQSDLEKEELINNVKNSLELDELINEYPTFNKTFNNLFINPSEDKFSKFCRDWLINVEKQSNALIYYKKLINKEYIQPINYYEDFIINIKSNELEERLKKIVITKTNMAFRGLYYDSQYQNNVSSNFIINSDVDLYARWDYENVDDFLNNVNFNNYTFDSNYAYAIISIGKNVGQDIYLGLEFLSHNIEVYKYNKNNINNYHGSNLCLVPYYSKNNKYYYRLETILNDDYNVLVLPREKLEIKENGIIKNYYNFQLSDNANITYTNDLKNVEIYDENGDKIIIDINDRYNYAQDSLIYDSEDLITIFKNLLKNKDNNIFSYFNQVWNYLKRSKLFTYINILIIGSLIILIIKAAKRH